MRPAECAFGMWYPPVPGYPQWSFIRCPLAPGHPEPHADVNYVPLLTTDEADFFNAQHALVIA